MRPTFLKFLVVYIFSYFQEYEAPKNPSILSLDVNEVKVRDKENNIWLYRKLSRFWIRCLKLEFFPANALNTFLGLFLVHLFLPWIVFVSYKKVLQHLNDIFILIPTKGLS